MGIFVLLLILFIVSFYIPAPQWYQKQKRMEAIFAKKTFSRTQKIKLTRAELCAKRGVNRVPKNDVMWNVYQWECAEYLARELWNDYRKIKLEMGEILIQEDKYRHALEQFLEATYIEKCLPVCDNYGKYPKQEFSTHNEIINYKHTGINTYLVSSMLGAQLSIEETREIFYSMLLPAIPFPITRQEAWNIIKPIIRFYIDKYFSEYKKYISKEKLQ